MLWDKLILELLQKSELSASAFADQIGVQRSALSHILKGRNKPSVDLIEKLLAAFPDLDANYLFGCSMEKPKPKDRLTTPTPITAKKVIKVIVCYSDATFDSFETNEK